MTQPDLTETQMAYNVAQSDMFQLAAYGHCRYTPRGEMLTPEGKAEQRDYNDRIHHAREKLEAATLRLVAERAESFRGDWGVVAAWLRSLADDPAALSLLAVSPEEQPVSVSPPAADRAAAPKICERPHQTIGEEEACELQRVAADRAALRKVIAHAIHRYDNHHALSGNDIPSKHHYGEADAVLAVLPETTEQAADVANLRTMYGVVSRRESDLIDERDQLLERVAELKQSTTSRADVLREAAAVIEAEQAREEAAQWAQSDEPDPEIEVEGAVVRARAALLRRMADEAPSTGLQLARYQTCTVCGAGYETGTPCTVCAFNARMANETQQDQETNTQPETEWAGATELASDRVISALAVSGLVGYWQNQGRWLHCLAHKPVPASRYADFQEVTADDLGDGGMCVHPRCGRDLLAPWPTATTEETSR